MARQRHRLTLKAVATASGVSESFLSQLERGRSGASIATLQRVAEALGISIAQLFEPDSQARALTVLQAGDRPVLRVADGLAKYLLTPALSEDMEVLIGKFEPAGTTGEAQYTHGDSGELTLVLSGTIRARLGHQVFDLVEGDSISYRSSLPHSFENVSSEVAEVLWIISPPSY